MTLIHRGLARRTCPERIGHKSDARGKTGILFSESRARLRFQARGVQKIGTIATCVIAPEAPKATPNRPQAEHAQMDVSFRQFSPTGKIKNCFNAAVFLVGKDVVGCDAIDWSETMRDHEVELHFTVKNSLGQFVHVVSSWAAAGAISQILVVGIDRRECKMLCGMAANDRHDAARADQLKC